MSYRIRQAWLSGNAVLQVSRYGKWFDADPAEYRATFYIVGEPYMQKLEEEIGMLQRELDAIKETRSRAARKGNATRKAMRNAPTLTSPLRGPGSYESNHGPYPRPIQS